MKQIKRDVQTFEIGEGFFVDVMDSLREEYTEVWLYHKAYGTKSLMFGGVISAEDIEGMILANVADHVALYKETVMDEE